MFCGKTDELIRRLERVNIAGLSLILFKPSIDDRDSIEATVTHCGRKFPATLLDPGMETVEKLEELVGKDVLREATVVAFDEGNFFSNKLDDLCDKLVAMGKRVIVAGLDLTSANKPFGIMPTLMAKAFPLTKLSAVCVKCGGVATRSQRLSDGEPASTDGPVIKVGGKGDYEARCIRCHVVGGG